MSDIDELVINYLKYKAIQEPDAQSKKQLREVETALNRYYWQKADDIVQRIICDGENCLTQKEINFIDFGLVDARLSGKKSIVATIETELTIEHDIEGMPRCYYLSEWLGERWNSFHTVQDIVGSSLNTQNKAQSEFVKSNSEIKRLTKLRNDVYAKIKPYLVGIPGLNDNIINSVVQGALDLQLENASLQCYHNPTANNLIQRNKIATIRRNIILALSQRLRKHKLAPLVVALDGIANNIWQEKLKISLRDGIVEDVPKVTISKEEQAKKQRDFLLGEMYIIKSLMPIAGIEGRKYKTSPVLLNFGRRITKKDVFDIWQKIVEVDPRLPGSPDMLLAPCEGSAFFEWDRDTLFIPIHPTSSIDDCIINGVANYKILMDMQGERSIKNFYFELNPKADFKTAFVRDYKDWIKHIGNGNKGSLKEPILNFFFENFAPDIDKVPAPRHLLVLSPMERQNLIIDLMGMLKAKSISSEQCFDLGILFWLNHKLDNAIKLLELALSKGMQSSKVLVCLGCLNKEKGFFKVASGYFRKACQVRSSSIWYLIAQRLK